MSTEEHDLHDLAAPYALDALAPLERRRFEAHLEDCATCAEEVAGFLDVAATLGAAEEAPVSDELRAAMAAVPGTVRQVGPRPAESTAPAATARGAGRRGRFATVAAAVFAVAAVGLGTVVVSQQQRIDGLERDAAVAAVLEQPDATVASAAATPDTTVRVVRSPSTGEGAVVVAGLPPLPSDQTYQVWWLAGEAATSAGLLDVDRDGTGARVLDRTDVDAGAVAISVEPAGGSPAPTTTPIAVVELT